jgi:DNA-binding MarR family transcriptional regulator
MLSALSTLEFRGALTLGELAEFERVRPPTMTRVIGRLEGADLVIKDQDSSDRRVTRVTLSSTGRRLVARHRSRRTAYLADRLKRLDPAESVHLREAVELLEKLLEE